MSIRENEVTPPLAHTRKSQSNISDGTGNIKGVIHSIGDIKPLDCFHENVVDQFWRKNKCWVKSGFLLSAKGPSLIYNPIMFIGSTCGWVCTDGLLLTLLGEVLGHGIEY